MMPYDLAIGFFDGVHIGHRRILSSSQVALTFAVHPLVVLNPECAPRPLMTKGERLAAIEFALAPFPAVQEAGVPRVRALDFTSSLAAMSPADFAGFLRCEYPAMRKLRCGPNWRFGKGGKGDVAFLRECGFEVEVAPFADYGGKPISSTRIRAALASSRLEEVEGMVGRPCTISGETAVGKGLGGKIGFPTINVRPDNPQYPLGAGVYVVDTVLGRGIANWGIAPTMGEQAWREPVLEVHLVDSVPQSVPARLQVAIIRFIRPERRFASIDELRCQIAKDVKCVK